MTKVWCEETMCQHYKEGECSLKEITINYAQSCEDFEEIIDKE